MIVDCLMNLSLCTGQLRKLVIQDLRQSQGCMPILHWIKYGARTVLVIILQFWTRPWENWKNYPADRDMEKVLHGREGRRGRSMNLQSVIKSLYEQSAYKILSRWKRNSATGRKRRMASLEWERLLIMSRKKNSMLIIYGDYFFTEAVLRLMKKEFLSGRR